MVSERLVHRWQGSGIGSLLELQPRHGYGQLQGRILGQLEPTPFTRTGNGHKSHGRKTVISRGRGNPGAKRRVQEKLLQLGRREGSREEPKAGDPSLGTIRQKRELRLL